jgi:predicted DNA binding CopG/RHH family protein
MRKFTMKKHAKLPQFKSKAEEREFWAKTDSSALVNWNNAELVTFPNLKPTVKSVSIRLPQSMIDELKLLANKTDVPYQSLMKIYLKERIVKELQHSA